MRKKSIVIITVSTVAAFLIGFGAAVGVFSLTKFGNVFGLYKKTDITVLQSETDDTGEIKADNTSEKPNTDVATENNADSETVPDSETETEAVTVAPESVGKIYALSGNKVTGKFPTHSAPYTIIIDPGHGFDDVGCTNDNLCGKTESRINLEIANILKNKLEAEGFNVIMLHDGSSFPSAQTLLELCERYGVYCIKENIVENNIFSAYERSIYANILSAEQPVDFYISLHVNSVNDGAEYRSGFEMDYCAANDWSEPSGMIFDSVSASVEKEFPDTIFLRYRDSLSEAFIVTKHTAMPSVLFEMGFATDKTDAENLLSDDFRNRLTDALTNGIKNYFYN